MISREDAKTLIWIDQNNSYAVDEIYDSIGSCGECYYAVNDCSLCEYHTRANIDGDIFEFDIPSKEYYCADFKRKET